MKLLLLTAYATAFVVPAPRFAGVRPQTTSPRKLPEWLLALKDALTAKCCVGDASGERGAAQ